MLRKPGRLVGLAVLMAGAVSTVHAEDWDVNRDFSMTQNPNGAWTYLGYLDDGFNWAQYYDNTYTWPEFHPWPDLPAQLGYYGNTAPDWPWGASIIFYWFGDPSEYGNPEYYSANSNQWWQKGHVRLHPAGYDCCYYPGIRWTAPGDMVIQVHALFYGCESQPGCGTYVGAHVLLNGNMYNGQTAVHSLFDAVIDGNYGCPALGIPATNDPLNHGEYDATLTVRKGDKIDFTIDGRGWYGCDLTGLDATITKLADVPPQTTEWDLAKDFSRGGNPNGQWTYGVYVQDADPFTFYAWPACTDWPGASPFGSIVSWSYYGTNDYGNIYCNDTDLDFGPVGPTIAYIPARKVAMQPACICGSYAPVVRWTAPRDMKVAVEATFYGEETITSSEVHILLNGDMTDGPVFTGTHLLDGILDGEAAYPKLGIAATGTTNTIVYQGILSLKAGDNLDFTVACNGGCPNDMTGVEIKISATCAHTPWADVDDDHDVDQDDFGKLQACITGPVAPPALSAACACFDRGGDPGVVTVEDLVAFMACWSGPGVTASECP